MIQNTLTDAQTAGLQASTLSLGALVHTLLTKRRAVRLWRFLLTRRRGGFRLPLYP